MQRLLIVLPVMLLLAGLVFGGGYFMYSADNAPAPNIAAADISFESESPLPADSTPLEIVPNERQPLNEGPAEEPTQAPETKPESPAPTKPVSEIEQWRKDIKEKLVATGLSTEDMERVNAELEKALAEMEAQQARAITLSGTVVDNLNNPVAGARIYATYADFDDKRKAGRNALHSRSIAVSDETGTWQGKLVPPQGRDSLSISLFADASDFIRGDQVELSVTAAESREDIQLKVNQGASISGRVVDQDFNPIAGARVMAYPGGKMSDNANRRSGRIAALKYATTDESGNFTLGGLNEGAYRMSATANGFRSGAEFPEVTAVIGVTTSLPTDLVLNRMTAVKVRLVCAERQPRGYVQAVFYDESGKQRRTGGMVDLDGNLLLSNVPDNAIEFEINASGYNATGRISVTIYPGTHNDAGEVSLTWNGEETNNEIKLRERLEYDGRTEDLKKALEDLERLKVLKELEKRK